MVINGFDFVPKKKREKEKHYVMNDAIERFIVLQNYYAQNSNIIELLQYIRKNTHMRKKNKTDSIDEKVTSLVFQSVTSSLNRVKR